MRIGKCPKCEDVFRWKENAKFWRVACPVCDSPLKRTTVHFKTKLVELDTTPYRKVQK